MPSRCCKPNVRGASSSLVSIESVCMAHNFAPETAAQAQAALFWNDPGTTIQPPGHWLQIADTVTADTNSSLLQTARATALAAIAMEDAGIAAWEVKYQYNAWRPITAIQDCSGWSTNFTTCDSTWSSLINTPPHPDYLAGHPAFSGAAATALEDALGVNDLTFTSTSNNYCNSGTTSFDSQGNVISCTVVISEPTGMTITSCPASDTPGVSGTLGGGNGSSGNPQTCTYVYTAAATAGASCVGGTAISDSQGYVIGCTGPDGAMSVTGGDCNNAGAVSVLNSDGSVNSAYNASPLICSIAESFDSISQASGGYLGAEFSRVVGGIHTPDAVTEALALGDDIGNIVASQDLPEPPIGQTLAVGLLILGVLRFRSRSRGEPVDAA